MAGQHLSRTPSHLCKKLWNNQQPSPQICNQAQGPVAV
jgi:hypothetical protein